MHMDDGKREYLPEEPKSTAVLVDDNVIHVGDFTISASRVFEISV